MMFGMKKRHQEVMDKNDDLKDLIMGLHEKISMICLDLDNIKHEQLHLCQHYENLHKKIDKILNESKTSLDGAVSRLNERFNNIYEFIQASNTFTANKHNAIMATLSNIVKVLPIEEEKVQKKTKKKGKGTTEG